MEVVRFNFIGIDELIDSIWMEVVSWDGDMSDLATSRREQQATDLEKSGQNNYSAIDKKATLYSYFIRMRNQDYRKIIKEFEMTEFT